MNVFEEMKEALGYDDLDYLVYNLCENDVNFGKDYKWENEIPQHSLRKEDEKLYNKLLENLRNERSTTFSDFVTKNEEEWGYEHLEQEGGGEGGSEYCYGVFKLKGKIYKAEYSYYSYNGHEYDGISYTLKEVKPVEKTIVVYE